MFKSLSPYQPFDGVNLDYTEEGIDRATKLDRIHLTLVKIGYDADGPNRMANLEDGHRLADELLILTLRELSMNHNYSEPIIAAYEAVDRAYSY